MKYAITIVLIFFAANLFAQELNTITVIKDPRIDILLKKQAEVNNLSTRNSTKRRNVNGYRILVISTNNRNEAIEAKTTIYNYFPELKPYLWHQSPYYKLKVGNFSSRADAQVYQRKLAPHFSKGVFIINDIIEVKPEEVDAD